MYRLSRSNLLVFHLSDRQKPNAMAEGVHGDDGAGVKVWFSSPNGADHDIADGGWEDVLRPDLNDAGFVGPQSRQQCTEIQVVRENDPAVGSGEIEDLGISCAWLTDC